jgi:putative transposase
LDYLAFERVMKLAHDRFPIRVLNWCIMPNHWHMVLWPEHDGELTNFVRQLTLTHAQRWKHAHNAVGLGHLYQGRFKSFPIQEDPHLFTVLRYADRNPLRAGLVTKAQDWRWGSLHAARTRGHLLSPLLAEWPIERPSDWTRWVNEPQTAAEEAAMKLHIARGRPFGDPTWIEKTVRTLHLEKTLRSRGRQTGWRKKQDDNGEAAQ